MQAMKVAKTIPLDTRVFYHVKIASAQVEAGDKKQALATLNQYLNDRFFDIKHAETRARLQGEIVQVLVQAGDGKQSAEMIQTIEHAESKASVLRWLIITMATKRVPKDMEETPVRHMRESFSPATKQIAKQMVEVMVGQD